MRHHIGLAVFLALMFFAAPARADIDQLCLKNCVNNGGVAGKCLSACTYGGTTPQSLPHSAVPPHHIFAAPQTLDDKIVLAPKTPPPPTPSKDFACFMPCLHSGQSYALCEQQCAKPGN